MVHYRSRFRSTLSTGQGGQLAFGPAFKISHTQTFSNENSVDVTKQASLNKISSKNYTLLNCAANYNNSLSLYMDQILFFVVFRDIAQDRLFSSTDS